MLLSKKLLSLEIAKKLASAIERKAIENNSTVVISIYGSCGNLKYFQRMDNTSYGNIHISKLKAKTSASLPFSSKALAEKSANMVANPYCTVPDILLLGGGVPIITDDGLHIGGIGVSGSATPELDELCAQAGLNAIKEDLN